MAAWLWVQGGCSHHQLLGPPLGFTADGWLDLVGPLLNGFLVTVSLASLPTSTAGVHGLS